MNYAITRKFLSLLYENDTYIANLVYDLSTVYPNKVNTLIYQKPKPTTVSTSINPPLDQKNNQSSLSKRKSLKQFSPMLP